MASSSRAPLLLGRQRLRSNNKAGQQAPQPEDAFAFHDDAAASPAAPKAAPPIKWIYKGPAGDLELAQLALPGASITHDTFGKSILIDQKKRGYLITELYGPSREVNADHWRVKKNEEEDEEEEEDYGGIGGDNYFGSESYSGDPHKQNENPELLLRSVYSTVQQIRAHQHAAIAPPPQPNHKPPTAMQRYNNPTYRISPLNLSLAEMQVVWSAVSKEITQFSMCLVIRDLRKHIAIDEMRIIKYTFQFGVANSKVDQNAWREATKTSPWPLNESISNFLNSAENVKFVHTQRRKVFKLLNARVKSFIHEKYYDNCDLSELTRKRDTFLYCAAPNPQAAFQKCTAFFDIKQDEIDFPSSNLLDLAAAVSHLGADEQDATPQLLAAVMTWTTEFKMTTDTALGGQTEEEHLSHFPTGEALHTSMGKILNTMASPDLCPSQEPAILAHQRDNEYVPPGDTEPPAEKGKKKQKVARPKSMPDAGPILLD